MIRASFISLLLCGISTVPIGARLPNGAPRPGSRYIVQITPSADVQGITQGITQRFSGTVGHVYATAVRGFSIELPPGSRVQDLLGRPGVLRVERDVRVYAVAQTLPTGLSRIAVDQHAGLKIDGADDQLNVDIAIIDTGIDTSHPDLRIVGGRRFYTRAGRSYQDNRYNDDNGHGTHCAGIAAAIDNDAGVVGVAPGARLWAVKVLDAGGSGYLSDLIAGIDWVTARATMIDVANMSLAATGKSDILRAAIQKSVAAGVMYVAAAGNSASDIFGADGVFNTDDDVIPAAYPEVAAISALTDSDGKPGGAGPALSGAPDDTFASFSNYSASAAPGNPVNSPGAGIDLMMPGVNIYSCWKGGGYRTASGTSMASPHAAGLAALYIAEHGRASNAAEVYAIRQALIDAGMNQASGNRLATPATEPDGCPENLGWAGPAAPTNAAPTVTILQPTDGSTLAGTITVRISASDAEDQAGKLAVQVSVDDATPAAAVYNSSNGDHEFAWNTAAVADGQHVLSAFATDTAGATSDVARVTVAVKNVDNAPTAVVASPHDGDTVSGPVTIQVQATDDLDAAGALAVMVSIGGDASQTAKYNPFAAYYELAWDSASSPDGTCTIDAQVTDSGSNTTHAAQITVTVNNTFVPATMHVASINVSVVPYWGSWQRIRAEIAIADASGAPVERATVMGTFSGDLSSLKRGATDASGQVAFEMTWWRRTPPRVTFCVDDVSHASLTYEPADNQQTCGSN
jgi:subtilisin